MRFDVELARPDSEVQGLRAAVFEGVVEKLDVAFVAISDEVAYCGELVVQGPTVLV